MNTIQYSLATDADIEVMVEYRIEMLQEINGRETETATEALRKSLEQYFLRALRTQSYICWIARSDEQFVGMGGMIVRDQPGNFRYPSGQIGYLLNVYTTPAFRRQGIASELVRQLIATASERGIHGFELRASKAGEPVYKALGFEQHNVPTYRMYT